MKPALLFSAILAAFITGCGNNSSTSTPADTNTNTSATTPASAPAGYLGALGNAQQLAVKTVDTARINEAIQMFQAEKGRFPKDLNELVQAQYLPKIPPAPVGMKLDYDPTTGKVSVVRQQ